MCTAFTHVRSPVLHPPQDRVHVFRIRAPADSAKEAIDTNSFDWSLTGSSLGYPASDTSIPPLPSSEELPKCAVFNGRAAQPVRRSFVDTLSSARRRIARAVSAKLSFSLAKLSLSDVTTRS